MAIRTEQVFLNASPATTKLIDVPPGPGQIVLTALSTGASVSFGPDSATLTGVTGAVLSAGQSVTIVLPPGSKPQALYGTGIGGTAIVGVVVSTPN